MHSPNVSGYTLELPKSGQVSTKKQTHEEDTDAALGGDHSPSDSKNYGSGRAGAGKKKKKKKRGKGGKEAGEANEMILDLVDPELDHNQIEFEELDPEKADLQDFADVGLQTQYRSKQAVQRIQKKLVQTQELADA